MEVEGLAEAIEYLRSAPKVVGATAMLKGLKAGGEVIKEALVSFTPIKAKATGGILREGELQASVQLFIELDSQFRGGEAIIDFGKNGMVAYWVEYGHVLVGHGANKIHGGNNRRTLGRVPEHPFVRPCADAIGQQAVDAFTFAFVNSIAEEFPQEVGIEAA